MASNDPSLYGNGKELEPSVEADLAQREGSEIQEARQKNVGELAFDEYPLAVSGDTWVFCRRHS